jgi:hypothetical protein
MYRKTKDAKQPGSPVNACIGGEAWRPSQKIIDEALTIEQAFFKPI